MRTAFVFCLSRFPGSSSERGGYDACNPSPILHALSRTAFPGRGIVGQPLPRLLALADLGRTIPLGPFAGADRAGRYLVVPADGRRLPARGAFSAAGKYSD